MRSRIIALAAFCILASCSGKPYVVKPDLRDDAIRFHKIYVVNHGWHAGLVLPARDVDLVVPELHERFGDVAFYELGWGDKGFYQAQEITTGLTLQAMFWSEGAVMHVVAVPDSPHQYFAGENVVETCLTDSEFVSLNTFVASSFAHDQAGQVISLKQGIYGDSQFYDGEGRYYLLNTCNKWAAKALSSAGFDISPTFKLTSGSVMNYVGVRQKVCTR